MKKHVWQNIVRFMLISAAILLGATAFAEDKTLKFQETKNDILDMLKQDPVKPKRREKGFNNIVADYEKLVQNPTARSLILFDYDSDVIKVESYSILQNYADVLQNELPQVILVIAGHTDSTGPDVYNLDLSKRRAASVKAFLVGNYQIDEKRLIIHPYGERQPLASNDTEEGQAQNRRVEFIRIQ